MRIKSAIVKVSLGYTPKKVEVENFDKLSCEEQVILLVRLRMFAAVLQDRLECEGHDTRATIQEFRAKAMEHRAEQL